MSWSGYAAGGMPLVVTQEDFLVHIYSLIQFMLQWFSRFHRNEFFLNNTNLIFLAFLYKKNPTSQGFKISKDKVASTRYWTHNYHLLEFQMLYPLSQSVSSCPLKSCPSEPEMIQVQFKDPLFNRCLCGWVDKAVGILIGGFGVVSLIPSRKPRNVIFVQKCQKCQICVI